MMNANNYDAWLEEPYVVVAYEPEEVVVFEEVPLLDVCPWCGDPNCDGGRCF